FLDQFLGQLHGPVVGAANLAGVGGGVGRRVGHEWRALDGREQLAEPRVGEHLVAEASQEGHLLAAVGCARPRDVGALVPAEDAGAGPEDGGITDAADQFSVGLVGSHTDMIRGFTTKAQRAKEEGKEEKKLFFAFFLCAFVVNPLIRGSYSAGTR